MQLTNVRSTLITSGAVLAVSGLVILSALGSAASAHAEDVIDPTIVVTAPAEPVEVVEPAAPAEPAPAELIDPVAAAGPAPVANDDLFPASIGVTDLYITDLYLNDSDPTSTTLEIDDPAGEVTFSGSWISVPIAVGFQGNRTFNYRTSGPNGTSNWAVVTLVPAQSSAQPVAYADSYVATSGATLSIAAPGLVANDTHLGGTVTGLSDLTGQVVIHADGSFEYTAPAGFIGVKTFNYQVTANGVPSNWGKVTVTVTTAAIPTAFDDFYTTAQNVVLDVPANGVLFNDSSSAAATVFAHDDVTGEITVGADGALHYTPAAGFVGTKTLHYVTIDNGQQGNWATITIVVTAVAAVAPVAVDDKYSMDMDTTLTVAAPGVLANDSSGIVWWHGGFYSGTLTLQSDGNFVYTPDVGFSGTTVISYTIRDNFITSNVATITIEVVDNQLPTLNNNDPRGGPISTTADGGTLAHTGIGSTWLALPALSIFLLGSLALGYSAARRRRAGTV